jgi:diacylglycerol kinase (ATP)
MNAKKQEAMTGKNQNLEDMVKQHPDPAHNDGISDGAAQALQPTKFQRIHIIVNPASGQDGLNLPSLNKVLKDLEVDWEMFVTRKGGEARERAQQAITAGVDAVVVYGGDGTVLEVASALAGSDIPMVILPGGTANVLSVELGIPADQTQAALLLGGVPNLVRQLDMGALGRSNDEDLLFFHLGMGLEGAMHQEADRGAKDSAGMLAYVFAALKTITSPTMTHYRLTLDGEEVEVDGINCMITNFGSIGIPGITLSHGIDVSDGLLDVIIIRDANVSTLIAAAANAVASGELAQPLLQWQAREITLVADPPQAMVVDGELIEVDSVKIRIVPHAVRIVVPAASNPTPPASDSTASS